MKMRKFLAGLGSTLILASGSYVIADDTDLYLLPSNISRDDSPNVLLLFDNSASMDHGTVTTAAAFDSSTIYSGASGNEFNNTSSTNPGDPDDFVYWCTSSSTVPCTQFDANLTAASVINQRIPVEAAYSGTNGGCDAAMTELAIGGGSTGIYIDNIAAWKPNGNKGKWEDLVNLNSAPTVDNHLDCASDDPADPTLGDFTNKGNNVNYTQRYVNQTNKALNWTAMDTVTLYSANYLNYLTNQGGASSTQTSMDIAKQAVNTLINSVRNVRLGLMVFNKNDADPHHGGRVLMAIDNMDDTRRTEMTALVNSLTGHPDLCDDDDDDDCVNDPHSNDENEAAANRSPLTETLWEAAQYLGGEAVDFGNNQFPLDTDPSTPVAPFFRDADAEDVSENYISPFNFACQQVFIVIVSDGEPTNDTDVDGTISALSANPSNEGQDIANDDENNGLLDELAGYLANNDIFDDGSPKSSGIQRGRVYTIGVGVTTGSNAEILLTDTANAGNGAYIQAADIASTVNALQTAVNEVTATTTSFVAPTLSVNAFNRLFNRDEVYFALFKPDTSIRWNGNIKKFKLCNSEQDETGTCEFGEVIDANNSPAIDPLTGRIAAGAVDLWGGSTASGDTVTLGGAGSQIPPAANRNLYAFSEDYTNLTFPVNLTSFPVNTNNGTQLYDAANPAGGGDPAVLGLSSTATQAEVDDLINWLLGQDSYDEDGDSDTTDQRWTFADPLHGQPVAVTFSFKPVTGNQTPEPVVKLFVGTNDGVIRMINDNTGIEEWAYIPRESLADQFQLAQNDEIVTSKYYGIDGTPSFWINDLDRDGVVEPNGEDSIANNGDDEFVYMYIGMRRGGKRIYAFDVTPNSVLTDDTPGQIQPKLLWVIDGDTNSDFANLGQTWSRPQVISIRFNCQGQICNSGDTESNTVLIFGGGYDPNQDDSVNDPSGTGPDSIGNGIYIVDPTDGSLILWISNTGSGADVELANMDFSIPSNLSLVDGNADGEVDRIYVGDTGGQLWRVDLGEELDTNNPAGTTGARLADIACTDGTRPDCTGTNGTAVQDRRKFFYPPDVTFVRDSVFTDPSNQNAIFYDLVTIASGDRADPTDKHTEGDTVTPQEAVHNRIYAFRDFVHDGTVDSNYPICLNSGNLVSCNGPMTENDLLDVTADASVAPTALQQREGWFIGLREATSQPTPLGSSQWVGEKSLASTLIFSNILFATTFVPASDATALQTCSRDEGLGRVFAVNIFTGEAALAQELAAFQATSSFSAPNIPVSGRAATVGGGIPSEVTIVIREGGVTGLVGVSGGTASPPVEPSSIPRFDTFWQQFR